MGAYHAFTEITDVAIKFVVSDMARFAVWDASSRNSMKAVSRADAVMIVLTPITSMVDTG